MTDTRFTSEEQALLDASPQKVRDFIDIVWPPVPMATGRMWMETAMIICGAYFFAPYGSASGQTLHQWYNAACAREEAK